MSAKRSFEDPLQLAALPVAVRIRRDEHVGRERRKARGDRPDVEVVHLADVVDVDHRAADLLCVQPAWRRLEQDPDRFAQERPRAREHEQRDRQSDQRVGVAPACREDDRAGQDHADRAERVGQHVPERALHVQALRAAPLEHPGRGEVERQPGDADHEHPASERLHRVAEPLQGLDDDPDRDRDERHPVRERCEDLRAPVAEAAVGSRGPRAEPRREERESEAAGVAEHVAGVGQERERVGRVAGDHLDHREDRHERERTRERPPVALAGGGRGAWSCTTRRARRRAPGPGTPARPCTRSRARAARPRCPCRSRPG